MKILRSRGDARVGKTSLIRQAKLEAQQKLEAGNLFQSNPRQSDSNLASKPSSRTSEVLEQSKTKTIEASFPSLEEQSSTESTNSTKSDKSVDINPVSSSSIGVVI